MLCRTQRMATNAFPNAIVKNNPWRDVWWDCTFLSKPPGPGKPWAKPSYFPESSGTAISRSVFPPRQPTGTFSRALAPNRCSTRCQKNTNGLSHFQWLAEGAILHRPSEKASEMVTLQPTLVSAESGLFSTPSGGP